MPLTSNFGINRWCSLEEERFLEIIEKELSGFSKRAQLNRVLVFPPFSSHFRFLVHKVVEVHSNLAGSSVGREPNRQTVVYFGDKLFKRNDQSMTSPKETGPSEYCNLPGKGRGRGRGRGFALQLENDITKHTPVQSPTSSLARSRRPPRVLYQPGAFRNRKKTDVDCNEVKQPFPVQPLCDVKLDRTENDPLSIRVQEKSGNQDDLNEDLEVNSCLVVNTDKKVSEMRKMCASEEMSAFREMSACEKITACDAPKMVSTFDNDISKDIVNQDSKISDSVYVDLANTSGRILDYMDDCYLISLTAISERIPNTHFDNNNPMLNLTDHINPSGTQMVDSTDNINVPLNADLTTQSDHVMETTDLSATHKDNKVNENESELNMCTDDEQNIPNGASFQSNGQKGDEGAKILNNSLSVSSNLVEEFKIECDKNACSNVDEIYLGRSDLTSDGTLVQKAELGGETCVSNTESIRSTLVEELKIECDQHGCREADEIDRNNKDLKSDGSLVQKVELQGETCVTNPVSVRSQLIEERKIEYVQKDCSKVDGMGRNNKDLKPVGTFVQNVELDVETCLTNTESVRSQLVEEINIDANINQMASELDLSTAGDGENLPGGSALQSNGHNIGLEEAKESQLVEELETKYDQKVHSEVDEVERNYKDLKTDGTLLEKVQLEGAKSTTNAASVSSQLVEELEANYDQNICSEVGNNLISDTPLIQKEISCKQKSKRQCKKEAKTKKKMGKSKKKTKATDITEQEKDGSCTFSNNEQQGLQKEKQKSPNMDENDCSEKQGEEDEKEDWESNWDETGECLNLEALLEELSEVVDVQDIKLEKPKYDYLSFKPKDIVLESGIYDHVVEMYDFSPQLKTPDLIHTLSKFKSQSFDIKWVDDTHALAVFANHKTAQLVIEQCSSPMVKLRSIYDGAHESKLYAKRSIDFLQPHKDRPMTSKLIANRLVTGALGMRSKMSKEERQQEREKIKAEREKKQNKAKQKKDLWDSEDLELK